MTELKMRITKRTFDAAIKKFTKTQDSCRDCIVGTWVAKHFPDMTRVCSFATLAIGESTYIADKATE